MEAQIATVVVGASAAGLATSACLTRAKVEHVLLEATDGVGAAWRGHYDRLHLHTHKGGSALPFVDFPRDTPRYPSRDEVVEYLERYVERLGLSPRFGEPATAVLADGEGWIVETPGARYRARNVVVATGLTRVPHLPEWPGRAAYRGELQHSSAYRNGERWRGRRVLVIGFGNSAGEIALDLAEHGATPTLSVRGAVNVIAREVLGVPVLGLGALLRPFPPRFADALSAPLVRATVGDITHVGLRKLPYGPMEQIHAHGTVPLIDIGTIAAIRDGRVLLRRGVEHFTETGARFDDGVKEPFDAVVAATGYRPRLADFLRDADAICGPGGPPSGVAVRPGLYFCGFQVSPRGMLRQLGLDARRIARAIRG